MTQSTPKACLLCGMYYDTRNLCAKMTSDELCEMNANSQVLKVKRGKILSDDLLDHWPIVAVSSGVLSLKHLLSDGRRVIAALFMRGDILDLRTASSRKAGYLAALSNTSLCLLSPPVFDTVLTNNPRARIVAWEGLNAQAFSAINHASDLAKKQALEKLASFIFECRHRTSKKQRNLVEIPIRRRDLADYLGMQPETVSRSFKELETQGILKVTDLSTVQILLLPVLRRIADGDRVAQIADRDSGPQFKIVVADG
jgi:CRP/FNR family transcriptional regulator, anaerobic regulatory protein